MADGDITNAAYAQISFKINVSNANKKNGYAYIPLASIANTTTESPIFKINEQKYSDRYYLPKAVCLIKKGGVVFLVIHAKEYGDDGTRNMYLSGRLVHNQASNAENTTAKQIKNGLSNSLDTTVEISSQTFISERTAKYLFYNDTRETAGGVYVIELAEIYIDTDPTALFSTEATNIDELKTLTVSKLNDVLTSSKTAEIKQATLAVRMECDASEVVEEAKEVPVDVSDKSITGPIIFIFFLIAAAWAYSSNFSNILRVTTTTFMSEKNGQMVNGQPSAGIVAIYATSVFFLHGLAFLFYGFRNENAFMNVVIGFFMVVISGLTGSSYIKYGRENSSIAPTPTQYYMFMKNNKIGAAIVLLNICMLFAITVSAGLVDYNRIDLAATSILLLGYIFYCAATFDRDNPAAHGIRIAIAFIVFIIGTITHAVLIRGR